MRASQWTEERTQEVRRLWAAGWSASQVAAKLKTTRNAVIGVVHRLGLSARRTVRTTQPRPRHATGRGRGKDSGTSLRAARARSEMLHATPTIEADKRVSVKAWEPLPHSTPIPLEALDPGMCKWPIGEDRPYRFCGLPAEGSYCAVHAEIGISKKFSTLSLDTNNHPIDPLAKRAEPARTVV